MQVLVPIAHGSESLETVAIVNVLRRAGVSVTLASIEDSLQVAATRDIGLLADRRLSEVIEQEWDAIVLPGGEKGAKALAAHEPLVGRLKRQRLEHKWIAAICAAPALVLSKHGLLDGKRATCYPAFRDQLLHYVDQPVVVDGHCIASQGPGTAIAFGLAVAEKLAGADAAREVASQMLAG